MRLLLLLLLVPGWHQVHSHNMHRRLLRLFRPGTEVPVTPHEHRHYALSGFSRFMANVGWICGSFVVIIFAFS